MFPMRSNGTREVRIAGPWPHLFMMLDITSSSQAHEVKVPAAGRAHHLEVSHLTLRSLHDRVIA